MQFHNFSRIQCIHNFFPHSRPGQKIYDETVVTLLLARVAMVFVFKKRKKTWSAALWKRLLCVWDFESFSRKKEKEEKILRVFKKWRELSKDTIYISRVRVKMGKIIFYFRFSGEKKKPHSVNRCENALRFNIDTLVNQVFSRVISVEGKV